MISLQAIEEELKRYDENLWEGIKKGAITADKELGKEHGLPEEKIQQEIAEDLEEARKHFEETKQNRYMLYEIYFTLEVKYGRNIANLAKEVLTAVTMGRMEQQELIELRTTIINMLGQDVVPPPARIKELFSPIIWNYGDGEIKERMLQEQEQRRVLAEQQAEEYRKQAEEERQQAEVARKQTEELAQRSLVLQQQILELKQQLQARESQKIAMQAEELSPSGSSSGDSASHSPQQHGAIPSSPVITTSFDMGTRTKQPLSEEYKAQEQCAPPAKKQCLHPSQDSQP